MGKNIPRHAPCFQHTQCMGSRLFFSARCINGLVMDYYPGPSRAATSSCHAIVALPWPSESGYGAPRPLGWPTSRAELNCAEQGQSKASHARVFPDAFSHVELSMVKAHANTRCMQRIHSIHWAMTSLICGCSEVGEQHGGHKACGQLVPNPNHSHHQWHPRTPGTPTSLTTNIQGHHGHQQRRTTSNDSRFVTRTPMDSTPGAAVGSELAGTRGSRG